MRILNAFMLHGRPIEELFSIAVAAHCDGLSIESAQLDAPTLDALAKRFELPITAVGTFFLDESDEATCLSLLEASAEKAALHGIRQLQVVLQSADGNALPRSRRLRFLQAIAEIATRHNVQVCLEPLHRSMRHVSTLTSLCEALHLIQQVSSPSLSLVLDLSHCFSDGMQGINFHELTPWIGTVHLSDIADLDQDERCFPGEGQMPLAEIIFNLRSAGYCGNWELEVIRTGLAEMPSDYLSQRIEHGFSLLGSAVVCGELAAHLFTDETGDIVQKQVGGSSGMIATQMVALYRNPILLGVCGDDAIGAWLSDSLQSVAPFSLCQPSRISSVVTLLPGHPDALSIRAGTANVAALVQQILRLPDLPVYGYIPVFPGYEAPLEVLTARSTWQMIHDFGFYLWSGDAEAILQRLEYIPQAGFCALVNAENMGDSDKKVLGYRFIEHNYRYALLTDGRNPVLLFSGDTGKIRSFPVVPCTRLLDPCGAGDCLTAGILTALTGGQSMCAAVEAGIEIASKKIENIGIWRPEACRNSR